MTITEMQAREHYSSVQRTARRLVGNRADADDIAQEALLRAIVYVRDGRKVENWRGYLNRIVRNVIADDYARRKRQGPVVDLDDVQGSLGVLPNQYQRHRVHEMQDAIDALPEQQHDVVQMIAVDGMSYRAAAEQLGVPVGTVMSRLYRGRETLKVRMDEGMGSQPAAAAA
ncbi:RNA polymerase sigma factor [Thalassobaculum sp. OXR-137]|uniref:RNA polymerase sigma factor n=1 Tax=Thalassobaculum sp. OXR-137 TaxID=3100173 RepID=UPI002AC8EC82|nr:RNA polymerase sigma factor [Thalassobaculum sp. OXR-137]WPZ33893.1 RNA polymerase sigma factor [Thalassobaculum sp. OXR-137]